jgi:hypothetical protein
MKFKVAVLLGIVSSLAITAHAQFVLDDYSVANEANYNFVQVEGTPFDGFAVANGFLTPNVPSGTAAWLWNPGQKLSAVGDTASIVPLLAFANGTVMGLFIAPTLDSASSGHQFYLQTGQLSTSYFIDGNFVGSSGSLVVKMTAQTDTSSTYDFAGAGTGFSVTINSPTAFFGPLAAGMSGPGGYPAFFDDLTYTPVPEPSACGVAFGLLAFGAAVVRSRVKGMG